jgi:hypothetical protein
MIAIGFFAGIWLVLLMIAVFFGGGAEIRRAARKAPPAHHKPAPDWDDACPDCGKVQCGCDCRRAG